MSLVRLRSAAITLSLLLPLSIASCGSDGATGGGDGDGGDDGNGAGAGLSNREVERLCNEYMAASCDYLADCYGLDEDECVADAERACEEALDADADEVDRCVSSLEEIECDESLPRACREAVEMPEDEDVGSGGDGGATEGSGGSFGGDGDGDGDGGFYEGTGGSFGGDGDGTCEAEVVTVADACDVDCDVTITVTINDIDSVFCTISCSIDGDCGDDTSITCFDGTCMFDCSGYNACPSSDFTCDEVDQICLPG